MTGSNNAVGGWQMPDNRKRLQPSTFNLQPSTFFLLLLCALLASCSVNKAKVDDSLKTHFDQYKAEGCFTLFNNADGKVTVYNMYYDTMRFTPASTFKIVNSLIGLETGVITDEKMLIRWDSVQRWNPEWNKDLTMEEAFKVSSVNYYQEVARRIGREKMQRWIDSLHYGNQRITGPIDSFWLNNTLKISPDEQLGLMKRLYFDQLPFQKRTQQIVRDVMVQESNTLYTLAYKTGWGFDEPGHHIGWITGWIEENKHPYFFALLVKSEDKNFDMRTARLAILKNILKQYGFFEGKK